MIEENTIKWKDYVDRIVENKLSKKIRNYRAIVNRGLGRPCKIWLGDRHRNRRQQRILEGTKRIKVYLHLILRLSFFFPQSNC